MLWVLVFLNSKGQKICWEKSKEGKRRGKEEEYKCGISEDKIRAVINPKCKKT